MYFIHHSDGMCEATDSVFVKVNNEVPIQLLLLLIIVRVIRFSLVEIQDYLHLILLGNGVLGQVFKIRYNN